MPWTLAAGKKLSCAAKMAKKRREADAVQVEVLDREKKSAELTKLNEAKSTLVAGLLRACCFKSGATHGQ